MTINQTPSTVPPMTVASGGSFTAPQDIAQPLMAATDTAAADTAPTVHIVAGDETLTSIADKYNISPELLYQYNQGALDRSASARGFSHSEGGRLLFPGELLSLVPTSQQAFSPVAAVKSNAEELAKMHQLYVAQVIDETEWNAIRTKLLS